MFIKFATSINQSIYSWGFIPVYILEIILLIFGSNELVK